MNDGKKTKSVSTYLYEFFPPLLGIVFLTAILGFRKTEGPIQGELDLEVVRSAMASMPSQLSSPRGTWVRLREVPVPSSQARLLDLGAYSSSEYVRLGEFPPVSATLFIAYCEDARSMVGHHPPNCYPSSGWSLSEDQVIRAEFGRSDGRTVLSTIYAFSYARSGKIGASSLKVVNGFFATGDFFSATLEEASRHVAPTLEAGLGLFQFQILFQGDRSDADVRRYADEIIEGIPSVFFEAAATGRAPGGPLDVSLGVDS